METLYYDFNRKEVMEKSVAIHRYGQLTNRSVDDEFRDLNIYPIVDNFEVPDGWTIADSVTTEELLNEGPIYVHDETNAWRVLRIYKTTQEYDSIVGLQTKYMSDIWHLIHEN